MKYVISHQLFIDFNDENETLYETNFGEHFK